MYLVTLMSLSFTFLSCDGVDNFVRIGIVPLFVVQGFAKYRL